MITNEIKQKIVGAMWEQRALFGGSDAKFAAKLGISGSLYSRVMKGDVEQVLSDGKWISIARLLEVKLGDAAQWVTAKTPVWDFVSSQLAACQEGSMSALLCDLSDIGKTYTARGYAKSHKNVVYVDCSLAKGKTWLLRTLAQGFGLSGTGTLHEIEGDLIYYLTALEKPLIILDEAGDLHYEAWMEVKALWNATEGRCGWYMMGADGLKAKIQRSIDCHKVGYTEIFSRFGKKYGKVVPEGVAGQEMMAACAAMIIKANVGPCDGSGKSVNTILNKTMGDDGMPSLRRIYKELRKEAV